LVKSGGDLIEKSINLLAFRKTMATGFVLVSVSPMREKEVFEMISSIDEVTEIYPLFGEYDILAKIEARDFDEVGSVVIKKIRAIPGVIDTKTLLTSESLKGK